jgi:RNA-directed DNA polymerase
MHIKGRGGVKGAVRCIYSQLEKYKFAARLDIKSYYASINHDVLMGILSGFELEAGVWDIIQQYLKVPDKYNKGRGIVAGGALSPFLGAVYLSPLDYTMDKLCKKKKIFYIRYQDDVVILAKNRWDFRKSLKVLYSVLEELKLSVHTEEKRYIGRTDKGFSFLGYFFKPNCKLHPSRESLDRLVSNSIRLFEQGADRSRLRIYLEHWLIYFRSGLRSIVQVKSIKKIQKFIDYNFKITYKYNYRLI